MRQLSSKEIKQIELSILKAFACYCEDNNLTYFLCGGTLLGAIRHHGFIPWDDDIDVFMPRPDYEKFYTLSKNVPIAHNLVVASYKNSDVKINYPFIKVLDNTTLVYEKTKSKKEKIHIWIDVFPIDGFYDDDSKNMTIIKKIHLRRDLLAIASADISQSKSLLKKIGKIFLIPLIKLIGVKNICKQIDRLSSKVDYKSANYVGGFMWGYGINEKMIKSDLTIIKHEFEDSIFNIPSNYDTYLSNLYGDYMKLPPEEKRIIHGFTAYLLKD